MKYIWIYTVIKIWIDKSRPMPHATHAAYSYKIIATCMQTVTEVTQCGDSVELYQFHSVLFPKTSTNKKSVCYIRVSCYSPAHSTIYSPRISYSEIFGFVRTDAHVAAK